MSAAPDSVAIKEEDELTSPDDDSEEADDAGCEDGTELRNELFSIREDEEEATEERLKEEGDVFVCEDEEDGSTSCALLLAGSDRGVSDAGCTMPSEDTTSLFFWEDDGVSLFTGSEDGSSVPCGGIAP